jgi:hypothetical protein
MIKLIRIVVKGLVIVMGMTTGEIRMITAVKRDIMDPHNRPVLLQTLTDLQVEAPLITKHFPGDQ